MLWRCDQQFSFASILSHAWLNSPMWGGRARGGGGGGHLIASGLLLHLLHMRFSLFLSLPGLLQSIEPSDKRAPIRCSDTLILTAATYKQHDVRRSLQVCPGNPHDHDCSMIKAQSIEILTMRSW